MRILIAGGAGFIGSHFTEAACEAFPAAHVTVLDKLTYAGVLANLDSLKRRPRFRFIKGDIADRRLVAKLLKETDLLFNFAAETHVDRSLLWADEFLKTQITGTFTLLEGARQSGKLKRMVLMSTDEVYGPILAGTARENSLLDPSSPYSAAKAGADLLALSYARSFRLPVIVPRACNIYGPRQFPEKMIPVMTLNALRDIPLPVYGNGRQQREWLFVRDACRALLLLAKKGGLGRIYNIGSGVWEKNIRVVKLILRRLGKPDSLIRFVTDRPAHDRRYAVNCSEIGKLGFKPATAFPQGLAETVDWYRRNRSWWEPLLAKTKRYLSIQYRRRLQQGKRTVD